MTISLTACHKAQPPKPAVTTATSTSIAPEQPEPAADLSISELKLPLRSNMELTALLQNSGYSIKIIDDNVAELRPLTLNIPAPVRPHAYWRAEKNSLVVDIPDEQNVALLEELGALAFDNQWEQIEPTIKEAKLKTTHFVVKSYQCQALIKQEKWAEAKKICAAALNDNALNPLALANLALASEQLGDHEAALNYVAEALIFGRHLDELPPILSAIVPLKKIHAARKYLQLPISIDHNAADKELIINLPPESAMEWLAAINCYLCWQYAACEPADLDQLAISAELFKHHECLHLALEQLTDLAPSQKLSAEAAHLLNAAAGGYLDEFLIWHILSPERPEILYLLPEGEYARLVEYLATYYLK